MAEVMDGADKEKRGKQEPRHERCTLVVDTGAHENSPCKLGYEYDGENGNQIKAGDESSHCAWKGPNLNCADPISA